VPSQPGAAVARASERPSLDNPFYAASRARVKIIAKELSPPGFSWPPACVEALKKESPQLVCANTPAGVGTASGTRARVRITFRCAREDLCERVAQIIAKVIGLRPWLCPRARQHNESGFHCDCQVDPIMPPNEYKMSDGGRERPSLGLEVWKSCSKPEREAPPGQRTPTPFLSRSAEPGSWDDYAAPNQTPFPRPQPVRSPSPR
jgi:hypothetical protein